MRHAITAHLLVPLRAAPRHSAELVSQLLLGEPVQVLASRPGWAQVRSLYDGYEAWAVQASLQVVPAPEHLTKRVFLHPGAGQLPVYGVQVLAEHLGALQQGPASSWLKAAQQQAQPLPWRAEALEASASKYLGAPYLWGGKSPLGVDCSGLVQMVYRQHGVALSRDAYQQAEEGTAVAYDEIAAGDLVFFDNALGRVVHVGLVLAASAASTNKANPKAWRLIHASGDGSVRMDHLSAQGIIHATRGARTHRLCSVRRYKPSAI